MNDLSHIEQVIEDLISKEKRKLAFEILEFYIKKAKTISDFDILGKLSLKAEHRNMYLYCAESSHALALTNEQIYASRTNLYRAYNAMNYPEKALFYIEMCLKDNPNDFDLLLNKAFNLALMNKRKDSENILQSLIQNSPKDKENIDYALSGKWLREGDTAKGILNFIDTFKPKSVLFEEHYKMEKWTGQPVKKGRTIYINGEGGIGDELINIRFMDNLKQLGLKPILYSAWSMYRKDIVDLFRRHGHEVITDYYCIDTKALWTNMMPIPGYLNLKEEELWKKPYIKPLKNPKNKIESRKIKIGIKKSGNPYFSQDEYRKIDLDLMLSYIPEEYDVYYIDKEEVNHPRVTNLTNKIETWEDTLDLIDEMDIIVSSCTSLVHASGAMGKRTIVIVPIAEYYVWTSTRTNETTPWYGDNFTVLKQTEIRSWNKPLLRMKDILLNEFPTM